jgi:CelD/BcsL family acetyltransferase involved in cellulose biosynthesis
LSTWWKYFGKGKELKIILVEEENGKLVGIAPLELEKFYFLKRLKFIGEHHSDYHDFILSSGQEKKDFRSDSQIFA